MDGESFDMRNRNRNNEEEQQGEEETNFNDNDDDRYRDPNRSINVIDTSNPNYNKNKQSSSVWEEDTIPNLKKDAGYMRRIFTNDKKEFFKKELNIYVNKKDGPFSKNYWKQQL